MEASAKTIPLCIVCILAACQSAPPLVQNPSPDWPAGWLARDSFDGPGVTVLATSEANAQSALGLYADILNDLSPWVDPPQELGVLVVLGAGDELDEADAETIFSQCIYPMISAPGSQFEGMDVESAWKEFSDPGETPMQVVDKFALAGMPLDTESLKQMLGPTIPENASWALFLPTPSTTKGGLRLVMDQRLKDMGKGLLIRSMAPMFLNRAMKEMRKQGQAQMLLLHAYPELGKEERKAIEKAMR